MPPKNTPRFLDYRQRKLPLDVALSFGLPPTTIVNCCSGSSSRDLILSGSVLVNNIIERSCDVLIDRFNDSISVVMIDDTKDGKKIKTPITFIVKPKYYICYKPRGVVCSRRRNEGIDREDAVLISDWLARVFQAAENIIGDDNDNNDNNDCSEGIIEGASRIDNATPTTHEQNYYTTIKTVGRLDEESEGALLITNDGSFSRLLCDPEFGLTKTYRVVVRGSGYNTLISVEQSKMQDDGGSNSPTEDVVNDEREVSHNELIKSRVSGKIERANDTPTVTTDINGKQTIHFPFESCHVLDFGKLPSQHTSDDSYYALIDLILCEGKRHAVRRICKNAQLRVCYLSRISVEGLDGHYDVVKPESIAEAYSNGFIPGGRHRDVVLDGKLIPRSDCKDKTLLHSGHIVELRDCDVDRIFALRRYQKIMS